MTSPKGLMAIAAAGAAALLAAGAAHPANEPETVATIPALVHALTEDGGRIAWIDIAWRLRVRGLRGGPVHSIRFTTNREEADDLFWEPRLILHGGTLFWRSFKVSHSGYERDRLTADVESRTWRQLGWTYGSEGYVGQHIAGIAADGDHVVYGLDVVRADEKTLDVSLVGGGIFTATASGARRKLPGAPPSKVLAAGGGLIAAAPIESEGQNTTLYPSDTVEIRDRVSGTLVCSIDAGWRASAAIDRTTNTVAVLVGQRFKRYDARRCELKGGVRVPGDARELHADAGRLAYRTRHTIVLVDLATGARRTVAATSPRWDIAGIALDGKRLTWAESTLTAERKYTTRIRTLVLY